MDLDAGDVKRAQADRIRARSPSNRRSGPNDVDIISNHLGVQSPEAAEETHAVFLQGD